MPVPSKFFLILMAATSLLLGLSYFVPILLIFSLLGYALLVTGIALDFVITPSPESLQVIRKVNPKLSLGDDNEIQIHIRNMRKQKIKGTIADNVPLTFQRRDTLFSYSLDPGASTDLSYFLNPHRRGSFEFESVTISVQGLLGLMYRVNEIPLTQTVKVYPSYLQLRKFQLQTRRANFDQIGKRKQRKYGEGREFESLREYTPDDEYRKVNWKATARRGRPIVSQFQIERNQNIIILLDAGRMMRTRPDAMTKLDHAINAALMLSFICIHKEDNIGLMVFNSKVQTFLPPKRGKSQLNLINEVLHKVEIEFAEPNYREAFHYLKKKISKRSLVILMTDLLDERASKVLITEFSSLYPRHLPLCISLRDQSLESTALMIPSTEKEMREMGVAQILLEERIKALNFLRMNGVLTLDSDSKNLTVDAINKYVEIKARSLI